MKSLFVVLCCALTHISAITLDDAYTRCKGVSRDELEPCIIQLVNDLSPLIQEGISALELQTDTCHFDNLDFEFKEGSNHLSAHYYGGKFRGLEDFKMTHLKIDYDNKLAVWSVLFPELVTSGTYYLDANVLGFPMYGNGTYWTRWGSFHLYGVSHLSVEEINGELHLQEKDTESTFSYGKAALRLNNLYDGDEILQQGANAFLGMNVDAFLDELRPSARTAFRTVTANHVNKALAKIKLDDLAGSEFIKEAFGIN